MGHPSCRARGLAAAVAVMLLLLVSPATGQDSGQVVDLAADPRVAEALDLVHVWLEAERAHGQIPGVAAGIVHDQELIWGGGFGVMDRDSGRSVTPDTLFSICSISKLFTAIAVLQQRDAGHLDLGDPVGEHLPWFALGDRYPEAPPATIRGLLTHSAGLPRESDFPYWSGPDFPFPTREQVRERVREQQELYPADTYFQYSNLGFTLAGELVAAAGGQPYAEYVREHVLDPLQMRDTHPEIPADHERLATGYGTPGRDGVRERVPRFQARGIAPAAGYASTVRDLGRFASWQFRLLEEGGDEVLAASSLRQMHRVHWVDPDWETHWGLGFAVWRDDDRTYVGHGGSCPGFRSSLSLQTGQQVAAIAMANAMVNPGLYTRRMQQIVAPRIARALDAPGDGDPPDPELDRYLGLYESFWGEVAVVRWKGGLALLSLPTDDPLAALVELRRVDEHVFRRLRADEELGEAVRFEVDEDGRVWRMWRHSNPMDRAS